MWDGEQRRYMNKKDLIFSLEGRFSELKTAGKSSMLWLKGALNWRPKR